MSTPKNIEPAISLTAFNCPHCGALAKQFWWSIWADDFAKDRVPFVVARDQSNVDLSQFTDPEAREKVQRWVSAMSTALPGLNPEGETKYGMRQVNNVWLARCFNCNDVTLWLYDRMIWPVRGNAPEANPDMPAEIRADYDEAATIADLSPRGAAALLRLALQKLCAVVGGQGKDLNADIAALVAAGLDTRVQKALDVVRVIGNNAVHPGQIDLRDDRATAGKLFALINLIVERLITQPKHVQEMFDGLPDGAKVAISKRDKSSS